MILSDDGAGFPADLGFENIPTIGLRLIKTLIQQLDGNLVLGRDKGTTFTLDFVELEYAERI